MTEFTSSITDKTVFGNKRVHYGSFNSSGATGGPITTGLRKIQYFNPVVYKIGGETGANVSGASISGGTANTLPVSGATIEILCALNASGAWAAWGL